MPERQIDRHATAVAHPNIALVKYWGKRDIEHNLPAAGSLSMTLGGLRTETSVRFDDSLERDTLELNDQPVEDGSKLQRVVDFLELVRDRAGLQMSARVQSHNDFPTGAGLASSASGFAALALAASAAAGLELSPEELSVLARRGSGSAARSLFGGFVEMNPGARADGEDAFAAPLFGPEHWDLRCVIAVTARGEKDIGSTEGMTHTRETSPYYQPWVDSVPADIERARQAVERRDFAALAKVAEASCLRMHACAMAADPGILYWNGTTVDLMHRVREARAGGLSAFFTIDAGPQLKVFCPAEDLDACVDLLEREDGVRDVLVAHPGGRARLVDEE